MKTLTDLRNALSSDAASGCYVSILAFTVIDEAIAERAALMEVARAVGRVWEERYWDGRQQRFLVDHNLFANMGHALAALPPEIRKELDSK